MYGDRRTHRLGRGELQTQIIPFSDHDRKKGGLVHALSPSVFRFW